LTGRDFAYYDNSRHDWIVNPGKFDLLVGGSSRDLALRAMIEVELAVPAYPKLSRYSLLKEFLSHPKGKRFYRELAEAFGLGIPGDPVESTADLTPEQAATKRKSDMAVKAFLDDMPVYKVCAFSEGRFTEERLNQILQQVQ
jgi:beta-glucosidase